MTQRAEIVPTRVRVIQQPEIHRRHAGEVGHAVLRHERHRARGVETRHQHDGATRREHGVLHPGLAEDVEQRQGAQRNRVGRQRHQVRAEQVSVQHEVRMRELGALRLAGGAARVQHH